MNGILAQCIAIATHGTPWLANPVGDPPAVDDGNSTFQYVSAVSFVGPDFTGKGIQPWLRHLAAAGAREIGITMPDLTQPPTDGGSAWHLRASYVGGLPVGLYTHTAAGSLVWSANWQPSSSATGEDRTTKPWRVVYSAAPTTADLDRPSLESARDDLVAALLAATEFARTHAMEPWDMTFEQARVTGLSGNPQAAYHSDALPADAEIPLAQRQLVAMATGAEVFGGMGSWNDITFDDPAAQLTYDQTSSTLYAAIMRAFRACVNTR